MAKTVEQAGDLGAAAAPIGPDEGNLSRTYGSMPAAEVNRAQFKAPFEQYLPHVSMSGNNSLTDASLEELAAMPSLRSLKIDSMLITPQGLQALAGSPLEELSAPSHFWPQQADQAASIFADMKHLKKLDLSKTLMTDDGMAQLSKSSSLQYLNLSHAAYLTPKSIDSLAQMTSLNELNLNDAANIKPSDLDRLRAALPNCKIEGEARFNGIDASAAELKNAASLDYELWRLAGNMDKPEQLAEPLAVQFSKMSKEELDKTARLLESKPFHGIVDRDAQGNVVGIYFNDSVEASKQYQNVFYPAMPKLLNDGMDAVNRVYRAAIRGFGNDVEIKFGSTGVSLEARQYRDITGKGLLWGRDKISVAYKPEVSH